MVVVGLWQHFDKSFTWIQKIWNLIIAADIVTHCHSVCWLGSYSHYKNMKVVSGVAFNIINIQIGRAPKKDSERTIVPKNTFRLIWNILTFFSWIMSSLVENEEENGYHYDMVRFRYYSTVWYFAQAGWLCVHSFLWVSTIRKKLLHLRFDKNLQSELKIFCEEFPQSQS